MTWPHHIDGIKLHLGLLELDGIPIAEMPDAAGEVRAIERRLATLRQGWNAEQLEAARDPESEFGPATFPTEHGQFGTVQPKVVGSEYRTVTTRTAKRTYNTGAILAGMVTHGGFAGTMDALVFAVRERLATVDWRWADLQRYCRATGLPLRTVPQRILDDGDLDGPWVGEEWREQVRQERIPKEGEE
jgi:hypothetical protein